MKGLNNFETAVVFKSCILSWFEETTCNISYVELFKQLRVCTFCQ